MSVRATFVFGLLVVSAAIGSSHGEIQTGVPAKTGNGTGRDVTDPNNAVLRHDSSMGEVVYLIMKQIKHLKFVGILHETFHCHCIRHLLQAVWQGIMGDYAAAKARDGNKFKQRI